MKRYNLLTVILCLCISNLALAQNYTFKVLANKGTNEVKSGADWKPLKTGTALQSGDELKVSENAYLGLVHSSGKTLELKSPGTHKVSTLTSKIGGKGSSVASKYADFVLGKISAEGKKNKLSATGAVHRGAAESNNIRIFVPSSAEVYNKDVNIIWEQLEGNPTYQVTLKNVFDDILLVKETSTPNFKLEMGNEKIEKENVVLLEVKVKGNSGPKSGTHAIKRLPKTASDKINQDLEALMKDVNEENALNKYILAGFYEKNNLLIDALTSYEMAMKLAPDVESYENAYQEFIDRNKLNQ